MTVNMKSSTKPSIKEGADKPLRILVMAGGTGGHVFPALAVADELRARGVEVSWLGSRRGLEADVVPKAGYPIDYINVSGLRGKGVLSWALAPVKLLMALAQGWAIMRRRHPSAVLGMGGFVTGPGGLAAWLTRCPLLIHEQNARAGLTNRLLVPFARRVMEAFPGSIKNKNNILHTGNPLRSDFVNKDFTNQDFISKDFSSSDENKKNDGTLRLLVVGGSLGAARLNEVVPAALAKLSMETRPEVWHQAGSRNIDSAQAAYKDEGIEARVVPFISDMVEAYRWADLVLCRAGAMTVAELAAVGVASILVPFPYAVDDHQTANARYLADNDAAVLLPQTQLTPERLGELIKEATPETLRKMAEAARRLALMNATRDVADQCMEVAHG
jgi:UDP-N-acetylglucosamine--N-acetylmuramyl-(pentapeptide) pyrophosphoryl-undecaprenol N-acetylglucosamine transferase